ncbi:hypothetical protein [Qipengyuania sp.]|uniref:hypothetical protein n=1 Tax=Qipengyuania sp. TaxID=2004515 RepID=UPI0035C7E958
MSRSSSSSKKRNLNGWRIALWGAAAALLLIPAVAMRYTREVNWTASDFVFGGVLLAALVAGFEVAMCVGRNAPHRLGIAIAALTGFLTVWINGAVGILGSEDEATNLAFIALVCGAVIAGFVTWFRARPMVWVMAALSVSQFVVGIAAALWTMPGHQVEWGVLAFFAVLWGGAAACFSGSAKTAHDNVRICSKDRAGEGGEI